MIEHDFDEDFVPIAAELQRLPYLSPSRDFADRVISRIDRLQPAQGVAPVIASRHLELQRGGPQAVARRRRVGLVRTTAKATAVVGLLAAATFMFFEIDVLTAILSAAASQYAFAIAAVGAQVGTLTPDAAAEFGLQPNIPVYHARAVSVATNKSPLGPYRGVGRSGACFAARPSVGSCNRPRLLRLSVTCAARTPPA